MLGSFPLGMGSEARWVREWTAFVEQFIDAVAGICGEEGWRTKITYVYVTTPKDFCTSSDLIGYQYSIVRRII
jgi:hypothetical protein